MAEPPIKRLVSSVWPATTTADDEALYRVIEIEHRTPTILELWLRPVAARLRYHPGEYVLLEEYHNGIPPRSYSIANAPRSDGLLSLLVTRVPDGQTSTWIHDHLRVGDDVSISGPYGTFVDGPPSTAPCLFLAAGSGLAPIRSLIEAALSTNTRRSLTLIFSARTEADAIDHERFMRSQAEHPHFHFACTLTRADGPGLHGRIPAVLASVCDELTHHDTFIAGAPGFVEACADAVEALGARPARVHTEVFFAECTR
jgi:CDP-4-dehydro-6-deoxyglucose reductase